MRVGIIGAGSIAVAAHIPGYQKLPDVKVVAISDIDAGQAREVAQKFGIARVFNDYHRLLEMKLDAVSVCTPTYLHAEAAIAALEAGSHVLCEKPMALNAAQAEQVISVAKRSGKILMMAFNNRFREDTQALKRMIEAGALGEIYFARAGWLRRRGIPGRGGWFTTKAMAGGGALIDIGVHALDLALWLMGNPTPAVVLGAAYAKFGHDPSRGSGGWGKPVPGGTFDVDDFACGMIRFSDGATLILEASWASHIEKEQRFLHLLGTEAGAEITGSPQQTRLFTERDGVLQDTTLRFRDTSQGGHMAEIAHFVECIRTGCQPASTGEDGLRVMRILDAIYASAQAGKAVSLG